MHFSPEVLGARERTLTFYPSVVFTFGLVVESITEFGGVSCNELHRIYGELQLLQLVQ
jgi:hypothetical protein